MGLSPSVPSSKGQVSLLHYDFLLNLGPLGEIAQRLRVRQISTASRGENRITMTLQEKGPQPNGPLSVQQFNGSTVQRNRPATHSKDSNHPALSGVEGFNGCPSTCFAALRTGALFKSLSEGAEELRRLLCQTHSLIQA
jgi:hypothetical protein